VGTAEGKRPLGKIKGRWKDYYIHLSAGSWMGGIDWILWIRI